MASIEASLVLDAALGRVAQVRCGEVLWTTPGLRKTCVPTPMCILNNCTQYLLISIPRLQQGLLGTAGSDALLAGMGQTTEVS